MVSLPKADAGFNLYRKTMKGTVIRMANRKIHFIFIFLWQAKTKKKLPRIEAMIAALAIVIVNKNSPSKKITRKPILVFWGNAPRLINPDKSNGTIPAK